LDVQGPRVFDTLYVAGGIGVACALEDNELIELLELTRAQGTAVSALGSGHVFLTAASLSCDTCARLGREISLHDYPIHPRAERVDALVHAYALLKMDLGGSIASSVVERLSEINTPPSR